MSSLGEVGAALRQVLDGIDQSIAAHRHAADLAREARDLLRSAGYGTLQADVEQACVSFTQVVDGIVEPEGQVSVLAHVAGLVRGYLTGHGMQGGEPGAVTGTAPRVPPAPPASLPERGSPTRVDSLRRELPPPVEPGSGRKTHGRWFPHGREGVVRPVVSGRDGDSDEIDRLFREEFGLPPNRRLSRTADVEQKIAMRMRREKIEEASVVINNVPCSGEFSCENLLGVILPPGYRLTERYSGVLITRI